MSEAVRPARWGLTRGDLLAVALAVAAIGALYARYWKPPVIATAFVVRVAGETVGHYPLDTDRDLVIHGQLGDSRLQVAHGRVRFVESPCRNKICVHSGWLSHSGDVAACLPNRVSVTLVGAGGAGLDAVSF